MNEDFQKLKDIGAQKIHEATHISKQHVQSILNDSFENMTKVQFLGFVSILEREFHLQLDDLKERGKGYFGEKPAQVKDEPEEEAKVFITPSKQKSYKKLYIIVAIIIFLLVAIFTISNISSSNDTQLEVPDNNTIENIQESIIMEPVVEENLSLLQESSSDVNVTKEEPKVVQDKAVVKSFKVIPKVKLWMGYIDLSNYKKYQKLTTKEFALDPKKDWLLSLGHGYVNFEVDGELHKFNIKKNVKFLYKDGELEKISSEEFKSLNRGHRW